MSRADDFAKLSRWRSTAQTWFEKVALRLSAHGEQARTADERWLVGYEATRLLESVLGDAQFLVCLLDDDQIEDVERKAKSLAALLRARRLAGKLENVEGRTPEEAATFTAAAARLRAVS